METKKIVAIILFLFGSILISSVLYKKSQKKKIQEKIELSRLNYGFSKDSPIIELGWKEIPANTWVRIEFGKARGNYSFKSYPDISGEKLRTPSGEIKEGLDRKKRISKKSDTYIDYWIPINGKIKFELIKK